MTTKQKSLPLTRASARVPATQTLFLALAACCGLVHFTESAQAEVPQNRLIWVRIDSDLLAPMIEHPIEEIQAVDEVILGVRCIGHAHVTGLPKMTLVDDADSAAFSVTITGTIQSRTTGRNGPVQIHSRSTTQFTATKRVAFHPGRGFVGEAAEIVARTSSQPEGIVPNRHGILGRAIEQRAWNRVAQSRAQVNQVVQEKAEAKIREAFDRLLEARLARVNQLPEQRYLVAALIGESRYDCWSSGGWLNIALSAAGNSMSDRSQCLEMTLGRYGRLRQDAPPVQVWVHKEVLWEPLTVLLRWTELARQPLRRSIEAAQAHTELPAVKLVSKQSSAPSYDFATIDDWFVFHAGGWNRPHMPSITTVPFPINVIASRD